MQRACKRDIFFLNLKTGTGSLYNTLSAIVECKAVFVNRHLTYIILVRSICVYSVSHILSTGSAAIGFASDPSQRHGVRRF